MHELRSGPRIWRKEGLLESLDPQDLLFVYKCARGGGPLVPAPTTVLATPGLPGGMQRRKMRKVRSRRASMGGAPSGLGMGSHSTETKAGICPGR